jgi:hypothetical protein
MNTTDDSYSVSEHTQDMYVICCMSDRILSFLASFNWFSGYKCVSEKEFIREHALYVE